MSVRVEYKNLVTTRESIDGGEAPGAVVVLRIVVASQVGHDVPR
jgi:hypothetical protein